MAIRRARSDDPTIQTPSRYGNLALDTKPRHRTKLQKKASEGSEPGTEWAECRHRRGERGSEGSIAMETTVRRILG
ncbi:hypothetical protein Mapa_014698 [Marchantia paleacea]|nr:hypothetical protein Mapa_014698 [Marchantia paleacea]